MFLHLPSEVIKNGEKNFESYICHKTARNTFTQSIIFLRVQADLKSPPEWTPPAEWPLQGNIEFSNYYCRYLTQQPGILKDISCHVSGGEKVKERLAIVFFHRSTSRLAIDIQKQKKVASEGTKNLSRLSRTRLTFLVSTCRSECWDLRAAARRRWLWPCFGS